MIDPTSTTLDWQTHPGDIVILPVGAFEQHSAHLPLETDVIGAGFFGRILAEELDAALLPTLPFATSLEHTGFRGTVSLRPETAMQLIREIADEVQRQQFRFLIVVNGHGGNFFLAPVIRDLNRQDRPLKVLLVYPWEFCDAHLAGPAAGPGSIGHSAEMETSVMLAIAPQVVRQEAAQDTAPVTGDAQPLFQRDLNTFGLGCFTPTGVTGEPSKASAERGAAIVESMRQNMIPVVKDRIRRLREQPRYSGAGGIAVRLMTEADVPGGLRLKSLAGWNQTEADWQMLLSAAPTGCFVAVQDGRVIGSTTLAPYGAAIGWIGMVLVDPAFRRLGIATRLVSQAMAAHADCRTIKLDATPAGAEVYRAMGFIDEYPLRRMVTHALMPVEAPGKEVTPITQADLPAVLAMDAEVFGAARQTVLRTLHHNAPAAAWKIVRDGRLRGLCLGRPGANFFQVGPVCAETADDAIALAKAALRPLAGQAVLIDVCDAALAPFADWLARLGLGVQRPFTRMFRGPNDAPGQPARQFAIAGPEIG